MLTEIVWGVLSMWGILYALLDPEDAFGRED